MRTPVESHAYVLVLMRTSVMRTSACVHFPSLVDVVAASLEDPVHGRRQTAPTTLEPVRRVLVPGLEDDFLELLHVACGSTLRIRLQGVEKGQVTDVQVGGLRWLFDDQNIKALHPPILRPDPFILVAVVWGRPVMLII